MTVVITGASAGIGEALARLLAARGARLVLAARRGEKLEALNAQLGGGHVVVACDVASEADCRRLVDTAARLGRIDTFVANAGYGLYRTVDATTPQQVRELFATNVFGTTDCCGFAAAVMARQDPRDRFRGQLMIVSSAAARRGVPYLGIYSGTKAAQLAIAEAMRVELRPRRIAVTSVHPVMTTTDFGRVAETGGVTLPRGGTFVAQTVAHVAKRMAAAIAHPTAEVWPHRGSRLLLGFGTLMPRVIDRGLARYRDKVDRANAGPPPAGKA